MDAPSHPWISGIIAGPLCPSSAGNLAEACASTLLAPPRRGCAPTLCAPCHEGATAFPRVTDTPGAGTASRVFPSNSDADSEKRGLRLVAPACLPDASAEFGPASSCPLFSPLHHLRHADTSNPAGAALALWRDALQSGGRNSSVRAPLLSLFAPLENLSRPVCSSAHLTTTFERHP